MSKIKIKESTLTETADAIREQEGSQEMISPSEFPQRISQIGKNGIKIIEQPSDVCAPINSSFNFTVVAEGTNLEYQWQLSTNNGANWQNSTGTGANTNSIQLAVSNRSTSAGTWEGRLYRCKITDDNDNVVYSNPAQFMFNDASRINTLERQLNGYTFAEVTDQAGYDSIPVKDPNTFYPISDTPQTHLGGGDN